MALRKNKQLIDLPLKRKELSSQKRPARFLRNFFILILGLGIAGCLGLLIFIFVSSRSQSSAQFLPQETLVYAETNLDYQGPMSLQDFWKVFKKSNQLGKAKQSGLIRLLNLNYQDEIVKRLKSPIALGLVDYQKNEKSEQGLIIIAPFKKTETVNQLIDQITGDLERTSGDYQGISFTACPKLGISYFLKDHKLIVTSDDYLTRLVVDCDQGKHPSLIQAGAFKEVLKQKTSSELFVYLNDQFLKSLVQKETNQLPNFFGADLNQFGKSFGLWIKENQGKFPVKTYLTFDSADQAEMESRAFDFVTEVPENTSVMFLSYNLQDFIQQIGLVKNNQDLMSGIELSINYFKNYLGEPLWNLVQELAQGDNAILVNPDNQISLEFKVTDSVAVAQKLRQCEPALKRLINCWFSQKVRTFNLPDGTLSSEIVESNANFRDDDLNGLPVRKLVLENQEGMFYGFQDQKLVVAFNRSDFLNLTDPQKQIDFPQSFTREKEKITQQSQGAVVYSDLGLLVNHFWSNWINQNSLQQQFDLVFTLKHWDLILGINQIAKGLVGEGVIVLR